jgi:tRNA A-37 threonylcarbamoyl transferase component Bud32/tetratricopeptide (TPR) repeat protein
MMVARDVRDQLVTALGGAYRLERELGGGGMSRVFLAHDETLGRDVVVKVLAPVLAEGLSADRFAREIRLAAALQEPHIVPVLAAGATADGLPYYTMPFVRGESLRARLQQGDVPIAEGVGILRDVATALEYAHARGIVHRDIKPENVLLSGRTAVVTDFGIAKALRASRTEAPGGPADGVTLTQVGASLGTPAYMAPEQAAGDPATDQRADLYAWGVIAYEVLTGRHPFAGRTSPQQLIAAHMSEAPSPLETATGRSSRGSSDVVPPALAALVMRCLAKDPDERPASAAVVLELLDEARDAALRASGAPSGRTLVRAFAVYAGSFVGVALLARVAINAIGLPDWVLPGALMVMALGLPVLLITSFVHHQTHQRAPEVVRSRRGVLAQRISPHFTWRRATTGGLAALGMFALLVAGYMVLRVLGIGPAGSLLAAGVLEDRQPLLVADFHVAGADTALGPVVAEAVRANLGQSDAISIVPMSQVVDALVRMQRPAASRLDAALAREVAQREGVSAIVGGELTPLGGGYLVTLRLISSETGDELASFRATADTPTDLIPTLDELARDLRGKIGESLKTVREDPRLDQVTTPSLDALRKFTAASRINIGGDYIKAAALFREAVALDSAFAMAWRGLGQALFNVRVTSPERDSAFVKAYRYRARLTEREALLSTAAFYQYGPHRDLRQAANAYEALIARDSNDHPVLNNLGNLLLGLREFERAEALLRRTAEARPRYGPYYNIAIAQSGQGNLVASESTAAFIMRRFPESQMSPQAGLTAAFARFDLDSAETRATRWQGAAGNPATRAIATNALVQIARMRGRLAEARRLAGETSALRVAAGGAPPALTDSVDAAREDLWLRGHPTRALSRLDALLASPAMATSPAPTRRRILLAVAPLYAAAGRADRAHALLDEFTSAADTTERSVTFPDRMTVEAEIALSDGRGPDALAAFGHSDLTAGGSPATQCSACVLPGIARAAERAGLADSARVVWERYVTTAAVERSPTDQWFLPMAYRRLGELYASVDRAKGAAYDERFLELWQGADAELQPQVAAVRRHLAQLRTGAVTGATQP